MKYIIFRKSLTTMEAIQNTILPREPSLVLNLKKASHLRVVTFPLSKISKTHSLLEFRDSNNDFIVIGVYKN